MSFPGIFNTPFKKMTMKKYRFLLFFLLLSGLVTAQREQAAALDKQGYELANQERYQEAIEKYTQAIKLLSDYAELYYNRAWCYEKLKMYDKAIADLEKAIQYDKNDSDAHLMLGYLLYNKGDKETSITHFGRVWDERKNSHNPFFREADSLHRDKKFDEALVLYKKCLDFNIALFYSNHRTGMVYYEKALYDQAIPYFDKATKFTEEKEVHLAHLMLGNALFKVKDYYYAINAFNAYIKTGPDNEQAYLSRGVARMKMYEYNYKTEALKDINKALELNPKSSNAIFWKASFFIQTQRFKEGLTLIDSLIRDFPTEMRPYIERGKAYVGLKQYGKALDAFQTVKNRKPTLAEPYLETGKLYLEQGMLEQAFNELETAKKLDNIDQEISIYHAGVSGLLGRFEEAKKILLYQVSLTNDRISNYYRQLANYFLAMILLKQNNENAAIPYFEASYLAVAESAIAYGDLLMKKGDVDKARTVLYGANNFNEKPHLAVTIRLAQVYLKQKDYSNALEYFMDANETDPLLAEVWLGMALAHIGLKKNAEAMDDLDKAIELDEKLPEAFYQRALLHLKNKDKDQARRDLQAATNLGHEEARKRLEKL
jgi:tetratricopeptide (TPR) repeat protein